MLYARDDPGPGRPRQRPCGAGRAAAKRGRDRHRQLHARPVLPGYHDDGFTVGVEGRWTLFAGGAASTKTAEARAAARAAEEALDAERESLAAEVARTQAQGDEIVSAYRLDALTGAESEAPKAD